MYPFMRTEEKFQVCTKQFQENTGHSLAISSSGWGNWLTLFTTTSTASRDWQATPGSASLYAQTPEQLRGTVTKKRAVRQKQQNLDNDRTLTVFGESQAGWMHCWGAEELHQQLRVLGAGKNATQTNKSERCSNKSGETAVVQLCGPPIR